MSGRQEYLPTPTDTVSRPQLDALGVVPASRLLDIPDGDRVLWGEQSHTGSVRPQLAGVTFINLEDETGMVNVVCSVGVVGKVPKIGKYGAALLIRGKVQNAEGAVTVVADRMQLMDLRVTAKSRDFR